MSDKIGHLKLKIDGGNYCLTDVVDIERYVCNSNYITILKGEGELIEGDDTIALICHDCENIYYFSDVMYKKNYKSL